MLDQLRKGKEQKRPVFNTKQIGEDNYTSQNDGESGYYLNKDDKGGASGTK